MWQARRRRFTAEQNESAVQRSRGARTVREVAVELGIHETVLGRWIREANADSGAGRSVRNRAEREELRRLRREVRRLRKERELLRSQGLACPDTASAFELIEAEKDEMPVATACSVLGVSRSGLYAWRARRSLE